MAVKAISGVIQKIFVKELPAPDRFENKFRRSIQVNDTWFSFGAMKSSDWNIKHGAGFAILGEGSEVMFKAESTQGKDGKEYWNGKGLTVLNLVEGQRGGQQQAGNQGGSATSSYQAKPKDYTGVEAGQSLNGAMNFIMTYGIDASNESIVTYGKKVHAATVKVKEAYKKDNPSVPEYDAGARCGLAILTACKLVGTDVDFESGIVNLAQDILTNVLEPITEFVKTPQTSAPPAKVTRAPVKKPAATKAQPVVEIEDDDFDGALLPF